MVMLLVLTQELLDKCQKREATGTEPIMASCVKWCVSNMHEFDHTECRRRFGIKSLRHGTYNDSLVSANVVPRWGGD